MHLHINTNCSTYLLVLCSILDYTTPLNKLSKISQSSEMSHCEIGHKPSGMIEMLMTDI